jgi:hypothetical protein
MRCYEIPLTPEPQRLSIVLGGKERRLRLVWGSRLGLQASSAPASANESSSGTWLLDISEIDDTPLLSGLPLVSGCDLLGQHGHLELGGELWVEGEFPPTLMNLGGENRLILVVRDGDA